jgi:3-deoxy-D-manno-octulosonate 8-phosphate phosphatase (KDO 8-P phosphatase)
MPKFTRQLLDRAKKIKLLLLDVDGVLTDGNIYLLARSGGGMFETKGFHSRDGLGIRLAHRYGIKTGIITGRGSPVIEHRAKELGIHFLQQHALEKLEPYERIRLDAQVQDAEVCYVGDDIVDLPLLKRVGLAVSVGDGHELLRPHVHFRTRRPGGAGAVREAIELILIAQGKWDGIVKSYLKGEPVLEIKHEDETPAAYPSRPASPQQAPDVEDNEAK